jgi:RNA polymerase sigma factor (sigma-70 family)
MGLMDTDMERLVEQAAGGDRPAFDALYLRFEKQIYGFIRTRAYNDADTQELAQQTWLLVWQKLPQYDRTRGSLHSFIRYWAGITLLRYYHACGRRHAVETLFSELTARFPDLKQEEELGEVMAALAKHFTSSAEEKLLVDEDIAALALVYKELLSLAFHSSSPPHQLIAFGFVKLLAWAPRQVVAELSDLPIQDLAQRLEAEYVSVSQLPKQHIRRCFRRLQEQMARPFSFAVTDARTRKIYPLLHDRLVGTTLLRDYYTGGTAEQHAADVTKWWDAVKRRVWSAAGGLTKGPLFDLLWKKE